MSADEAAAESESILQEAQRLVYGDREKQYGNAHDDFKCSAQILSALVERRYGVRIEFEPDFIGLIMACCIKGSRAASNPKRDTLVDGAGYFGTMERCLVEQNKESSA